MIKDKNNKKVRNMTKQTKGTKMAYKTYKWEHIVAYCKETPAEVFERLKGTYHIGYFMGKEVFPKNLRLTNTLFRGCNHYEKRLHIGTASKLPVGIKITGSIDDILGDLASFKYNASELELLKMSPKEFKEMLLLREKNKKRYYGTF